MKQVTFTDVRNHAKQYFDMVASGETVRVTQWQADKRQLDAASRMDLRVGSVCTDILLKYVRFPLRGQELLYRVPRRNLKAVKELV